MAINGVSQTSSAPQSTGSGLNITDSTQTFLTLLMTQLKTQDPMSPMDPTQMVTQLTQFSSLSELMQIRQLLTNNQAETTANSQPVAGGQ